MRKITGRALSDSPDACQASEAQVARSVAKAAGVLETLLCNLGDMSRFEHREDGERPPPIAYPIFRSPQDEKGNWPGDDPPLYVWIEKNLPLPRAA
jgi:hypothetical protein